MVGNRSSEVVNRLLPRRPVGRLSVRAGPPGNRRAAVALANAAFCAFIFRIVGCSDQSVNGSQSSSSAHAAALHARQQWLRSVPAAVDCSVRPALLRPDIGIRLFNAAVFQPFDRQNCLQCVSPISQQRPLPHSRPRSTAGGASVAALRTRTGFCRSDQGRRRAVAVSSGLPADCNPVSTR